MKKFIILSFLIASFCASKAQFDSLSVAKQFIQDSVVRRPEKLNSSTLNKAYMGLVQFITKPVWDTANISVPKTGMSVFQRKDGVYYFYDINKWKPVGGASGSMALYALKTYVDSLYAVLHGFDNWGTEYVHAGPGFIGLGTPDSLLQIDPTYIAQTSRLDSLVAAVAAITGGVTPISVTNAGSAWPLINHPTTSNFTVKSFSPGSNVSFDTLSIPGSLIINAIIPGGGVEVNSDTFSLSVPNNRTVGTDKMITYILVKPVSSLAALKIGTISNATNYLTDTPIASGGWTSIDLDAYIETSSAIYFAGVTSATQFKIITTTFHE